MAAWGTPVFCSHILKSFIIVIAPFILSTAIYFLFYLTFYDWHHPHSSSDNHHVTVATEDHFHHMASLGAQELWSFGALEPAVTGAGTHCHITLCCPPVCLSACLFWKVFTSVPRMKLPRPGDLIKLIEITGRKKSRKVAKSLQSSRGWASNKNRRNVFVLENQCLLEGTSSHLL